MDGNLLDPDNADATLAKEWNLPELPAGVQEKLLFQTMIITRSAVLFYLKCTGLHHDKTKNRVHVRMKARRLCMKPFPRGNEASMHMGT